MTDDITRDALALPAGGGEVGFYTWDVAQHAVQMAALRKAAYRRRFIIVGWGGSHGHNYARLIPMSDAPVRCCSGTRGRGKARAHESRRKVNLIMEAYRYRDRLALRIGWERAVKDPTFNALVRNAMRPRGGR